LHRDSCTNSTTGSLVVAVVGIVVVVVGRLGAGATVGNTSRDGSLHRGSLVVAGYRGQQVAPRIVSTVLVVLLVVAVVAIVVVVVARLGAIVGNKWSDGSLHRGSSVVTSSSSSSS